MITFGIQIGLLAVRVTVVTLVACLAALGTARRDARSSVMILAGALAMCLAVGVIACWPVPDSLRWSPFVPETESQPAASTAANVEAAPGVDSGKQEGITFAQMRGWLEKLGPMESESSRWRWCWFLLGIIYILGVTIGGMRVILGWLAICRLRRRSLAVADEELIHLVSSLRAALGIVRPVEVCACLEPGLAATTGWRRPIIFLPPEWPSWSTAQRQAVLAHELAHVRRRDYLVGLLSGLCRLVYFYHPLVRWLASRLRWQQEVAADALAAPAAGGREIYLKSLARLALDAPARMPARPLVWSAFSGTNLLRRIRMLQGTRERRPLSRIGGGICLSLFALTGWLVTTVGMPQRLAGAEKPEVGADQPDPFEIGYLAPEARAIFAVRPSVWMQQPGMDKFSKMLDQGLKTLKEFGLNWPANLRPENIDQIVMDWNVTTKGTGAPGSRSLTLGTSAVLVRMNQDVDWVAMLKDLSHQINTLNLKVNGKAPVGAIHEKRQDGVSIFQMGVIPMFGPQTLHFYMPDRRTIVFFPLPSGDDDTAFRKLIANVAASRRRDWGTAWSQVNRAPLAMVVDNRDANMSGRFVKDLEKKELNLLEKIALATLGIELGDGRPVRLTVDATSTAAAQELAQALDDYARMGLAELRANEQGLHPKVQVFYKLAIELLQSRQLLRQDSRLEWRCYSSLRARHLVGAYVAAYTSENE